MTARQPVVHLAVMPPDPGGREPGPGPEEFGRLEVGRLLRRLARGWWLIVLAAAAGLAAAHHYLRVTPPVYLSQATVQVEQETRPLLPANEPGGGREDIRAIEMLKTIEQGLVSQDNLLRVIEVTGLAQEPDVIRALEGRVTRAGLIQHLQEHVQAELRRGTRLIDLRVKSPDPERSRRLAQALVDEYVRGTSAEATQAAHGKVQALRSTGAELSREIAALHQEMQTYRAEHKDLSLDKEANIVAEKLKDLTARLTQSSTERNRLEAAAAEIARLGDDPPIDAVLKVQGIPDMLDVSQMKASIAEKESTFAQIRRRYGPKHPKFIQAEAELSRLKDQLTQAARNLSSALQAALRHAEETERGLREQIDSQQALALELEKVLGPYRLLQSRLQSAQASFDAVQAQIKTAEVTAVAAPASLTLADRPVAASRPAGPRRKLAYALGGGGGMALGGMLVLLGGLFSRRLGAVEEAERALGLPALAAVPRAPFREFRDSLVGADSASCAEAFRTLRASLGCLAHGQARVVLFTSPEQASGCSFVAMNHAAAVARQGYRTLLIEANLHHPQIAQVFGEGGGGGLAGFLQGGRDDGSVCRPTGIPELFVLSAGPPTANGSELITGQKMAELLEDARRWFQRVVIDAAALEVASDALVLATRADATVLVLRPSGSRRLASLAIERLRLMARPPVGFVLNAVRGRLPAWQPRPAAPPPVSEDVQLART